MTWAITSGKKEGTAKVQAKVGKKKYSCTVTVKAKKTTQTTKTSSSAVSVQSTETPEQGKVLTLYYDDENAEQVLEQMRYSGSPVHVIVENSVTGIGNGAFRECSNLTSILWNGNLYTEVDAF